MANVNLNNAAFVYAQNALTRLQDVTETKIFDNPANSGKVIFLESIYVANVSGNNCALTINIYDSATNATTPTAIVYQLITTPDVTLLPVLKDGAIVIKENQSVYATASVANALHIVTSWKELS